MEGFFLTKSFDKNRIRFILFFCGIKNIFLWLFCVIHSLFFFMDYIFIIDDSFHSIITRKEESEYEESYGLIDFLFHHSIFKI